MTPSDADPIAEGMLQHLRSHDPAAAMLILTHLVAKAILAATPAGPGMLEHSTKLFFGSVPEVMAYYLKERAK